MQAAERQRCEERSPVPEAIRSAAAARSSVSAAESVAMNATVTSRPRLSAFEQAVWEPAS